jgi:glycosyltransferase involved in cell wall biosynthesis
LGKFDFLMVESPPLFLGYSAIWLSKKLKAKLIFNVSDLWPESAEKLGIVTNKYLLKLAYQLEAKCYKEAYLVTGQTQGIVDDISFRFPSKRIYYLPNGVDTSFYDPQKVIAGDFRERNGFKTTDLLIFYGGILGHAQGLEVVLNAANLLKDQLHVHFILQGTGPEQEQLLQLKANLDLKQVHFFEPVQKKEMPSILKSVDVAIIPLKKLLLFEGAIPSKVYEALAMKKPLLLGVSGEAKRHFIDKAKAGLYFEPENHEDLAGQIISLVENPQECLIMGENARNYVSNNFDRDKIAKEFLAQLV